MSAQPVAEEAPSLVEQAHDLRLEAEPTERAEPDGALEGTRQREPVAAEREERTALIRLEGDRIVANVVAGVDREHDDLRRKPHHEAAQSNQLLGRAVAVASEVEDLRPGEARPWRPQSRALLELALRDRAEGLGLIDLRRFGKGIAEHGDAQSARLRGELHL